MEGYANWSFYTSIYNGVAISQTAFDSLIQRASAEVDKYTYDKAAGVILTNTDLVTIDKIKLATCAVAEMLQLYDLGGIVASESVGSHSVSYVQDRSKVSKPASIRLAIKTYLAYTELMDMAA